MIYREDVLKNLRGLKLRLLVIYWLKLLWRYGWMRNKGSREEIMVLEKKKFNKGYFDEV